MMKFGKYLESTIAENNLPEWEPMWLNYRLLKKMIRNISLTQEKLNQVPSRLSTPEEMARCEEEVYFFRVLEAELRKGSRLFRSVKTQLAIRLNALEDSYRYTLFFLKNEKLGMHLGFSDEFEKDMWTRNMNSCLHVYRELLLLQQWMILSYCGFSKILKKHDRWTGFTTREKYLSRVESLHPFADASELVHALRTVNKLFLSILEHIPDAQEYTAYKNYISGVKAYAEKAKNEYDFHVHGPKQAFSTESETELSDAMGSPSDSLSNRKRSASEIEANITSAERCRNLNALLEAVNKEIAEETKRS